MSTVCAERQIPETMEKIHSIDFGPILFSLIKKDDGEKWSEKKALDSIELYKKFLFLMWKYPSGSVVPNKIIDLVWHVHILDTKKYHDDCMSVFGEIIHHFPYLGTRGQEDRQNLKRKFAFTSELFQTEFGIDLSQWCQMDDAEASHCQGGCERGIDNVSEFDRPVYVR